MRRLHEHGVPFVIKGLVFFVDILSDCRWRVVQQFELSKICGTHLTEPNAISPSLVLNFHALLIKLILPVVLHVFSGSKVQRRLQILQVTLIELPEDFLFISRPDQWLEDLRDFDQCKLLWVDVIE